MVALQVNVRMRDQFYDCFQILWIDVLVHHKPGCCAVHRTGVNIEITEFVSDSLCDGGFSRAGRAVDGNDEGFLCSTLQSGHFSQFFVWDHNYTQMRKSS